MDRDNTVVSPKRLWGLRVLEAARQIDAGMQIEQADEWPKAMYPQDRDSDADYLISVLVNP